MEKLIALSNRLQELRIKDQLSPDAVQLPQVVLIGSKGVGKSSVLERIVGKDFLPRRTPTRQPLVLDLVNSPKNDKRRRELGAPNEVDFAIFEESPKTVYVNFAEVRFRIQQITSRNCGSNNGIVNIPIKLKIYSDRVGNLSLVDLPGITNMAVGDQPENIGEVIRSMVTEYIQKENSIILAVSAADHPIVMSEALGMAKDVDRAGNRTLAVITKLDLMDQGTNAKDVLKGKIIPVKLGIVGVRNRDYPLLDQPLEEATKEETRFLNKHYADIAGKHGVEHLRRMLSKLLLNHIQTVLPSLTREISETTIEFETCTDSGTLIDIINKFCSFYKEQTYSEDYPTEVMLSILHDQLAESVDAIRPLDGINFEQMRQILLNAQGLYGPFFECPELFKELLRPYIEQLEIAAFLCVDEIRRQMSSVVEKFSHDGLERFPLLRAEIIRLVEGKLTELVAKTKDYVSFTVLSELSYINTQKYSSIRDTITEYMLPPGSDGNRGKDITELFDRYYIELIYRILPEYFSDVRNNVKNYIPKLIVNGMLKGLNDVLNPLLVHNLHKR